MNEKFHNFFNVWFFEIRNVQCFIKTWISLVQKFTCPASPVYQNPIDPTHTSWTTYLGVAEIESLSEKTFIFDTSEQPHKD